jgi:hypothetical protein
MYLEWAQDGATGSMDFGVAEIVKGSATDWQVIRSQGWAGNALLDEGEIDILDVYFKNQAVRANLYFRLYSDNGPIVDTDTLSTILGEQAEANGYLGIAVVRDTDWSEPALDGGDGQTTTVTKQFSATGSWSAADELILATVQSGTGGLAIAWVDLSTTRTLTDGDTLDVDMAVKLA